jgi:hypothetical protein
MNDVVKILLVVTVTTIIAMTIGYGMVKFINRHRQPIDNSFLGVV